MALKPGPKEQQLQQENLTNVNVIIKVHQAIRYRLNHQNQLLKNRIYT